MPSSTAPCRGASEALGRCSNKEGGVPSVSHPALPASHWLACLLAMQRHVLGIMERTFKTYITEDPRAVQIKVGRPAPGRDPPGCGCGCGCGCGVCPGLAAEGGASTGPGARASSSPGPPSSAAQHCAACRPVYPPGCTCVYVHLAPVANGLRTGAARASLSFHVSLAALSPPCPALPRPSPTTSSPAGPAGPTGAPERA
jgi:hypothetical protein